MQQLDAPPVTSDDRERESRSSPIDVHVGSRIRLRRTLLGMSQEKLGEMLGLTFQQVQKYERGVNRVGASRLFALAKALDVPIAFFFDDMPGPHMGGRASSKLGRIDQFERSEHEFTAENAGTRETEDLLAAYYRIPDAAVRKVFCELLRAWRP